MLPDQKFNFIEPDSIHSIIKPLEALGIIGFFFARMYPDGHFVDLTTNAVYSEFFFKKFYAQTYSLETITSHMLIEPGVSLSELNPHMQNWQDNRHYFNIGNAITLSRNYENYYENYHFFADKDNYAINQFYLNHIDFLYQFVDYFKQKASPLILKGESSKFVTPEKYLAQKPSLVSENSKDFAVQRIMKILQNNNMPIAKIEAHRLSKTELMCLSYLIQGKSAEEISIILSRSKRTIERHIENSKQKLNCHKISQLAYLLGKLNIDFNKRSN